MKAITRELESMEPSGGLVDLLLGVDVGSLSAEQLLTLLIVNKKMIGALEYVSLTLRRRLPDTTEVAMATHEPEQSVVRQKESSAVLERLPRLCELLRRGELDLRRLQTVDDRVINLP